MVKGVLQFFVVVGLVVSVSNVFASEVKELEAVFPSGRNIDWAAAARVTGAAGGGHF